MLSSRGRLQPIGATYLVQPGGKTENIARVSNFSLRLIKFILNKNLLVAVFPIQADTQAMFDAPEVESVPIWIIVAAALAGFFLLSGCIYLLWKV